MIKPKENGAKNIILVVVLILSIAATLVGVTLYASDKVGRAEFASVKESVIKHDAILPRIENALNRIERKLEKIK